jgi:hypothetical protein
VITETAPVAPAAPAGAWDVLPAGAANDSWSSAPAAQERIGPVETLIWLAPATDIATTIPPPPPAPPVPGYGADFGAFSPAGHPLETPPTDDGVPAPPPTPQAEPLPIMFTPRVAWPTGSE